MTLLILIYALNNCTEKKKSWCINSLKSSNKDTKKTCQRSNPICKKDKTDCTMPNKNGANRKQALL
jgi:octaprenyl-diphosphate synthase